MLGLLNTAFLRRDGGDTSKHERALCSSPMGTQANRSRTIEAWRAKGSLASSRRVFLAAAIGILAAGFLGMPSARAALQQPPAKSAKAAPNKDLKVLFVGNSYVYVNELPKLLGDLAKSAPKGPQISFESVTPGGVTLRKHFESTGALEKIRAGEFTHVVLQGQSLEPVANPEEFLTFAHKLAKEVEKSGATVVFYQTWARQAGAKEYGEAWSGGTPQKMQDGLSAAYAKAAADFGGRVARVGDAWRAALEAKDPPKLFDADGSHPSQSGTYLAACVFYETLTGKSCLELEATREGLDSKTAEKLRTLAHALTAK